VASEWPQPDKHAPTDSPQVQEWLKEIEGVDIPDIPVTVNGSCADTPANAAKSADYGWWTCTGTVRSSDIVSCPDKYTWGLTFDDGPAPYSTFFFLFTAHEYGYLFDINSSVCFLGKLI
jgi:hypothetical protein